MSTFPVRISPRNFATWPFGGKTRNRLRPRVRILQVEETNRYRKRFVRRIGNGKSELVFSSVSSQKLLTGSGIWNPDILKQAPGLFIGQLESGQASQETGRCHLGSPVCTAEVPAGAAPLGDTNSITREDKPAMVKGWSESQGLGEFSGSCKST